MQNTIYPKQIYDSIIGLPEDELQEIMQFIQFVKYKNIDKPSGKIIKLGGLLADYNINFSDKEIEKARKEMWEIL